MVQMESFTTADNQFMAMALQEAELAFKEDEVPIGAVLVFDGKIIARGRNSVINDCDQTQHAEMKVLRKGFEVVNKKFLYGCTLYSTIEPCIMCMGACVLARIDRLVYGADEPKTGAICSVVKINELKLNHTIKVDKGLMRQRSVELIRSFFENKRLFAKNKER